MYGRHTAPADGTPSAMLTISCSSHIYIPNHNDMDESVNGSVVFNDLELISLTFYRDADDVDDVDDDATNHILCDLVLFFSLLFLNLQWLVVGERRAFMGASVVEFFKQTDDDDDVFKTLQQLCLNLCRA